MVQLSNLYSIMITFDFDDIIAKDNLCSWFYSIDYENLINDSKLYIDKIKLNNSLFNNKFNNI